MMSRKEKEREGIAKEKRKKKRNVGQVSVASCSVYFPFS